MSAGAAGASGAGAPGAGVRVERARLFVAFELPEVVRRSLAAWAEAAVGADSGALAGWRAVRAENLHLTLCFLGELPVSEVAAIARACATLAGAPALRLELGEPLWLPPRRPRVLAVGLTDSGGGTLVGLQARLALALRDGGWYEPEARPFLPHVTVARGQRGARPPARLPAPPALAPTSAATVSLLRSRLGGGGPRYERLSRCQLED